MKKYGRGFVWTKEQEKFLIDNYSSENKELLIARLNRSWHSIKNKARKLNIKINTENRAYNKPWSAQDEQYLKENYEFGDLDQIAKKLNRTRKAVTERAKILKITRDIEIVRKQSQIYEVNEDFFKTWSHEMAFILGLICSDGHVSQKHDGNRVGITLHKDDRYLIQDIYNAMESTHKVYRTKNVAILNIENKHIYSDLIKLGIQPAKSKTIGNIKVPKEFIASFILGTLDGDGSVDSKRKRAKIVTASKEFADCLSNMLSEIDVEHKVYNEGYKHKDEKHDFYVVRILRRAAIKKLYNQMYANSSLFLKRKKRAFEKMGINNKDFDSLYSCNLKPIIGEHKDTGVIIKFNSVKEAIDAGACNKRIYKAFKNDKHHKGYYWSYA
jgi:hypothetical protein